MSYPESNSARCHSSSAADSDGALLSRIEPPLLDISSRVRQKKMQAEGKNPQYQSDSDERRVMIMTTMLVPEQSDQLAPRQMFPNNLKLKQNSSHFWLLVQPPCQCIFIYEYQKKLQVVHCKPQKATGSPICLFQK